ncbi:MAG: phage-shock protein [Peptococcaceae bacterium]|nr:MAG: phage-shock protein [Peptococcaceae bacterium]
MDGKIYSLTDVLKKTLFFFESLSVAELTPYVHRKMLKDYTQEQVEKKVNLCLEQNPCFYAGGDQLWHLNLEGIRENDQFYALLLKRGQPLNLREILKIGKDKKKKFKDLIAEEASLISDGRFIQLDNGYWGLTEWEVETSHYSSKHLVIKALKTHPGGLSLQQLFNIVNDWRATTMQTIEEILNKFPFFEQMGDGIWTYNPIAQVVYEELLKRFLTIISKQKMRRHSERLLWNNKIASLRKQLQEIIGAHREVAAALAERIELTGQHEQLKTQMAEKDLLLSLRKKEIMRYREHLVRLENKANSILHQCRLWVKRAREGEEVNARLKEMLNQNQGNMENIFVRIQQYKEKDRENKARLAEIKERHSIRVAELQTEIVELKQRMEREIEKSSLMERRLREEINALSNDLKKSLSAEEEYHRFLRFTQQELAAVRGDYQRLSRQVDHPLVRLAVRVCSFFNRNGRHQLL